MLPTATLTFQDRPLDVYEIDGTRWLTGAQIGPALGYDGNASRHVKKIYERHKSEFDRSMTALIYVDTANRGIQKTRMFSPRGAALVAMLAKTERAAEFRAFVLDVLEGARLAPAPAEVLPAALRTEFLRFLRAKKPLWPKIARYAGLGLSNTEIARLCERSPDWVRKERRQMEALGVMAPPAYLARRQRHLVHMRPDLVASHV